MGGNEKMRKCANVKTRKFKLFWTQVLPSVEAAQRSTVTKEPCFYYDDDSESSCEWWTLEMMRIEADG